MKKSLLTIAALALLSAPAFAADLPARKAPPVLPPPPPPPMWTGFYVGLNAGGTWGNDYGQRISVGAVSADPNWGLVGAFPGVQAQYLGAYAFAASPSGANNTRGGFIGGGQIGYNYQFAGQFVAGVEADIQGIASNNNNGGYTSSFVLPAPTFAPPFLGPHAGSEFITGFTSARGNLNYLGTVRGRIGWLVNPTLLVYGTGGFAYGGVTLNSTTALVPNGSSPWVNAQTAAFGGVNYSNTQVGWTAGGGLEWMFWPNWSAKVEYLYYKLASVNQNFAIVSADPTPAAGTALAVFAGQARAQVAGNIVRAGVNYHFNWGAAAPVVAKY
jgi:outer membrane immunogenic protein